MGLGKQVRWQYHTHIYALDPRFVVQSHAGGVGYNEKDEMALSTFLNTDGRSVVFTDTPGFDDARKGTTDAKSSQFS